MERTEFWIKPYSETEELFADGALARFDSLVRAGRTRLDNKRDSLRLLVDKLSGKDKAELLISMCDQRSNSSLDLESIEKALEYSERINFPDGQARCWLLLARFYSSKEDTTKVIQFLDKSQSFWESKDDKVNLARLMTYYAGYHIEMNRNERAKEYLQKARELNEIIKDSTITSLVAYREAKTLLYVDGKHHVKKALNYATDPKLKLEILQYFSIMETREDTVRDGVFYLSRQTLPTLNLALNLHDSIVIANTLFGIIQRLARNKYESSKVQMQIDYMHRSIEILPESAEKLKSFGIISLGDLYKRVGQTSQAMGLYLEALELVQRTNNELHEIYVYQQMADVYKGIQDYDEALKYVFLMRENSYGKENPPVLFAISNLYLEKEDYKEALEFMLEATSISRTPKLEFYLMVGLSRLGLIYHKLGESRRGLDSLREALRYTKVYKNEKNQRYTNGIMGRIYFDLGETDTAIRHLELSIGNANRESQLATEEYLSMAYAAKKDYKNAYKHFFRFKKMSDSLNNEQEAKKIGWLESQVALEIKDNENKLLLKDKELLAGQKRVEQGKNEKLILLSAGLTLGIFLIGWIFFQRAKNSRKLLDKEREMDQIKSHFYSNISHELRTPLALIIGPLQDALTKVNAKEQQILQRSIHQGEKLQSLVDEILDLSKIDAKKMEAKPISANLASFTRRIIDGFQSYAKRKGASIHLSYMIDEDIWWMLDRRMLEKILSNLLSNALKYSGTKGEIQMVVIHDEKKNKLQLNVKDQGPGISASDLPHVFDRYYQASGPDNRIEGGTGIGLNLAFELAKLMGGELKVESKLGQGSVFTLEIPAIKALATDENYLNEVWAEKEEIEEVTEYESGNWNGKNSTILVAEDNPDMAAYLEEVLSPHFQLKIVENGQEAWEILSDPKVKVDLLLSDMMMPVMDGNELLEKVKSNDGLMGMPMVMLTARADIDDKLNALTTGVDDYITKPFHSRELLVRVENLLRRAEIRQQTQLEAEEDKGSAMEKSNSNLDMPAYDVRWLKKVELEVMAQLSDSGFTISKLSLAIGLGERQLHRKLKKLTGLTPNHYIREIRLNKARTLLELGEVEGVAETAYRVGFDNARYFSDIFRKRFGRTPSTYLR